MVDERALSRLHYELIRGLIEHGACPSNTELATRMSATPKEIERLLYSLADSHGVVLHPHACEPWIVHPFSLTPTINWIEGEHTSWWAPCIWCALGGAGLVGGNVRIHTRFGAEAEPLVIPVSDGRPTGLDDVVVHFAIAPARAWDNVHRHCSMVLPFRSEREVDKWCVRHRLPRGEVVALPQVVQLAHKWYGHHSDPHWRKWTVPQAQEIFESVDLRSEFWNLGATSGRF